MSKYTVTVKKDGKGIGTIYVVLDSTKDIASVLESALKSIRENHTTDAYENSIVPAPGSMIDGVVWDEA